MRFDLIGSPRPQRLRVSPAGRAESERCGGGKTRAAGLMRAPQLISMPVYLSRPSPHRMDLERDVSNRRPSGDGGLQRGAMMKRDLLRNLIAGGAVAILAGTACNDSRGEPP